MDLTSQSRKVTPEKFLRILKIFFAGQVGVRGVWVGGCEFEGGWVRMGGVWKESERKKFFGLICGLKKSKN